MKVNNIRIKSTIQNIANHFQFQQVGKHEQMTQGQQHTLNRYRDLIIEWRKEKKEKTKKITWCFGSGWTIWYPKGVAVESGT